MAINYSYLHVVSAGLLGGDPVFRFDIRGQRARFVRRRILTVVSGIFISLFKIIPFEAFVAIEGRNSRLEIASLPEASFAEDISITSVDCAVGNNTLEPCLKQACGFEKIVSAVPYVT